jgi:hypothetical protein
LARFRRPASADRRHTVVDGLPQAGRHSRELRNNYVLIDHENVQPHTLHALKPAHFKVFVFVGDI